jgi:hypothetical protein
MMSCPVEQQTPFFSTSSPRPGRGSSFCSPQNFKGGFFFLGKGGTNHLGMETGENGKLDVRVAVRVWARKAALQAMPADGCIRLLGAGNREDTVLRFGSVFGPDASQV